MPREAMRTTSAVTGIERCIDMNYIAGSIILRTNPSYNKRLRTADGGRSESSPLQHDRIVIPFDDLAVLEEKYADAMPHLQAAAGEMVVPFVEHHRAFGKRRDHLKALHDIEEGFDTVRHGLPA